MKRMHAGNFRLGRLRTLLALPFTMLLLTACLSPPSVPEDHFYLLPNIDASKANQKLVDGTIAVASFKAFGIYSERSLLYVDAQRPLELKRYHYRLWAKPPNQLIQENFIAYLRAGEHANSIVQFQPGINSQVYITGQLIKFERVIDTKSSKVIVAMELQYHIKSINTLPLLTRTYESNITTSNDSFQATAESYGQALKNIYDQFIQDIQNLNS